MEIKTIGIIFLLIGILVWWQQKNKPQKKTYEELKDEAMMLIKQFAQKGQKAKLQKAVLKNKEELVRTQNAMKFLMKYGL